MSVEPVGADAGSADELGAGAIIARRYQLTRKIASGGMSTIWEATHLTLQTPVAVKLIQLVGPNLARIRARFLREARVAAAVRHRDVVRITDFGTTEDGIPYMVMERLNGRTLAERLREGPGLSVGEVVRIVARVLAGLSSVHHAGIVHRDLKPENIFLTDDPDGPRPKLLDFGVSRALDPQGALKSVLPTTDNAIVGTPQYMSPEQARGLPGLDHRSDLFSAGVILYELLTGRLPFAGEAVGDIIIQIATADPLDFATLRPDLVGPIERVVKKAMSKKVAERYQSAREMRADLLTAAAATAQSIQAARSPVAERSSLLTASDLPPVGAAELIDAVGDAYEPGDSGLLDFGEHLPLPSTADRANDKGSGLRRLPPAPRPTDRHDPFAPAPAGADEAAPHEDRRRGGWQWFVAGLLISAGVFALVQVAVNARDASPTSERPRAALEVDDARADDAVRLTLHDLPANARVTVDGEAVAHDAPLVFARGHVPHVVEVRAPSGERWRTRWYADSSSALGVTF